MDSKEDKTFADKGSPEDKASADAEEQKEKEGEEELGPAAVAAAVAAALAAVSVPVLSPKPRPSREPEPEPEPESESEPEPVAGPSEMDYASTSQTEPHTLPVNKTYRCEECRRLFQSQMEIEYHAVKSGHTSFTESEETKKQLTDEEKKKQLRAIEEKMRLKRKEREERERKEEVEKEKKRIQTGKELSQMRERMKEEEMKKMIEKHKRDKIEDQKARQRIKAQIEADKIARRYMFGEYSGAGVAPPPPPPATETASRPQRDYAEARIQIRLTNGRTMTHTFASREQLSAVRLFVEMNRTDGSEPFSMMTNFPKRVFTEDDYDETLETLGLSPSAVIIVSKKV